MLPTVMTDKFDFSRWGWEELHLELEVEKLAEERHIAREGALEWTREVKMENDEERERKSEIKKGQDRWR